MTTETVCVPRELLTHALSYASTPEEMLEKIKATDQLRALLAQPVASEPVAWMDEDGCLHTTIESAYFRRGQVMPLYLHQPSSVIPEGYALVPIEPTEAMRDAGNIYSLNRATLMRIWADMLGAAQQPTEGSTDD